MFLNTVSLQNFRNYTRSSFSFDKTTIIIGKNTVGKTNILEAIRFLSHGKSFRAEKDIDSVKIGCDFARIEGKRIDEDDMVKLTVLLAQKNGFFSKKYLVNNVSKRQSDFVSQLLTVLFSPTDIEIITHSPSLRRQYMNDLLYQANRGYRLASSLYEKALKNRNKLLFAIKEGKRIPKKEEFEYWDNLLIEHGATITFEREKLVEFLNKSTKEIFDFIIMYDKSTITRERLDKYFAVEQQTGITLVGPQRDDFVFLFPNPRHNTSDGTDERSEGVRLLDKRGGEATTSTPRAAGIASGDARPRWKKTISEFGSRGEQRLTILQLKLLEIDFLKKETEKNPILLLDDIFSELDNENIEKILKLIGNCQTIITTTHREFVPKKIAKSVKMIELE